MANHNFNTLLHGTLAEVCEQLYCADRLTEPYELAAALTNAFKHIEALEARLSKLEGKAE